MIKIVLYLKSKKKMLFENLLFVHLQRSWQYTEKNLLQLTALVQ